MLRGFIDKEIRFVDLRFTDTKGKEQHVTVPASQMDEDFFEDGSCDFAGDQPSALATAGQFAFMIVRLAGLGAQLQGPRRF